MKHLVAVFAALGLAAGSASAQSSVCGGKSLLPEIERERPAVWKSALEAFDAVPNGTGLFWRIERPGLPVSWLLGTIHVPDADVATLAPAIRDAFDAADTIVVETTALGTPEGKTELAQKLLGGATLPEGTSFDAGFSQGAKDELAALTAAHGIPYFAARKLKPWFLSVMLSFPPCSKIAMQQGQPVLDETLYRMAVEAGKAVVGLETADEQIAALQSLEAAIDPDSILEMAELGISGVENWYATLIALYKQERVALITPLMQHMPELRTMAAASSRAEENLIGPRNQVMHERVLPHLLRGKTFLAVGALHLPGKDGLVELLRNSGFAVTPAP